MKNFLIVFGWITASFLTLFVGGITASVVNNSHNREPVVLSAQIAPESRPLSMPGESGKVQGLATSIQTGDARPIIIEQYMEAWNAPMVGYGQFITDKADELAEKHNLNSTYLAFLIVAIGQKESNLGKLMPSDDCHNAWGWGIHAAGTLCFDSWEEGIDTVMSGIAQKYMVEQGLNTPEEIMQRYTPHSPEGAWAKGVTQFLKDLEYANY